MHVTLFGQFCPNKKINASGVAYLERTNIFPLFLQPNLSCHFVLAAPPPPMLDDIFG
jgi:hypothetical protein